MQEYKLEPYRGITALKKNGKLRPLLVPTPRDRLVFSLALPRIKRLLESRLARYNALGVGVDYDDAPTIKSICLKILEHLHNDGLPWILALDFQDYFSSIDRKKLDHQLRPIFYKAGEKALYAFVASSVNNTINMDAEFEKNFGPLELAKKGIPQGLAYSPLLASFFGIKIDRIVARNKKVRFYRYLDDMIILGPKKEILSGIYEELKVTAATLGLKLHPLGGKTKLLNLNGGSDDFEFLGVTIAPKNPHGLLIPADAIEKFKDVIRLEIFTKGAADKHDPEQVKKIFQQYTDGWVRHYKTICPDHYLEVAGVLNAFIKEHMAKKRGWQYLYKKEPEYFQLS